MPRLVRMLSFATALLVGLAACTSEPVTTGYGIDAGLALAMFPSDCFTRADEATRTGLRVALPAEVHDDPLFRAFPDLVAEIESLDGFGTSAPVWVRFAGPVDPASFPTLAESANEDASVQLIHLESGQREPFETRYDAPTRTLFVHPYGALAPASRYALVVTDKIRSLLGAPLQPSGHWRADGIPVKRYLAATVFTTQSVTETLGELALRSVEHGAGEFPAATSQCTSDAAIGWTGKGYLRSPDYRTQDNRFPVALDDREPQGEPKEMRIPYIIVLPKNTPAAPTVLVQHGLADRKERALLCRIGRQYAERGFATIAIDGAWHGERGPNGEPPNGLSYLRVLFGIWTDGEEFTARLRYGRDAFRQTALDHVQLAALVKTMAATFDTDDDDAADLSGDVFYNGSSMGGIIGSLTTAVAPNIPAAVLNVPGGRLSNLVLKSRIHLYELVAEPIFGATAELSTGDTLRFLALFQTIAERADPINYARHWWKEPLAGRPAKSVIVQETIDDVLVPNRTTEDLARAGQLPQLKPALRNVDDMAAAEIPAGGLRDNLAKGVSGGMMQLEFIHVDGVKEKASHGTMHSPEALGQAASFFDGWLDGAADIRQIY